MVYIVYRSVSWIVAERQSYGECILLHLEYLSRILVGECELRFMIRSTASALQRCHPSIHIAMTDLSR